MACDLGCNLLEDHHVLVMDRGGRQVVGEITNIVSFLKYGRELDDDSECEVSVHFTSDAVGHACCELLEDVRTWRHEIAVYRDDELVWQGPIINLSFQREIGHITARDIMAWADVRVVEGDYTFENVDLTTIAETVLLDAIGKQDDVGVLDYVQSSPAGATATMEIVGKQQTAGEVLRNLARTGLDFTVIGRSLVLGADFAYGPIGPLLDEHFLGDVEVEERGLAAATKYFLPGKDIALGVVGECGGSDDYYGLIERAVETFSEVNDQKFLDVTACTRVSALNPPPIHVSIPEGSALSPRAPVCPELLVPGTLVDLDIRTLCRRATARQRLTAVEFRVDDKGEQITPTIAPYGAAFEASEV